MPEVAIVIPVYNRLEQLLRALDTVVVQSFSSVELIVVDDASTDDLSAARRLVEESGNRWVTLSKNRGPAAARNAGVAVSRANWISFLDSDDEWEPDKIARQWEWHQENPEFAISQVEEAWYRNGATFAKPKHLRQKGGDLFELSCQRCAIGPSCVMMTRELWNESGAFDERFRVCEDYALWLLIAARNRVGLVPGRPLVKKHAGHSDQLSVETPLMERYRFLALLEWLKVNPGQGTKEASARESLCFFGEQLKRYGEKNRIASWAVFFGTFDFCDAFDDSALEKAWAVFHHEWLKEKMRN